MSHLIYREITSGLTHVLVSVKQALDVRYPPNVYVVGSLTSNELKTNVDVYIDVIDRKPMMMLVPFNDVIAIHLGIAESFDKIVADKEPDDELIESFKDSLWRINAVFEYKRMYMSDRASEWVDMHINEYNELRNWVRKDAIVNYYPIPELFEEDFYIENTKENVDMIRKIIDVNVDNFDETERFILFNKNDLTLTGIDGKNCDSKWVSSVYLKHLYDSIYTKA